MVHIWTLDRVVSCLLGRKGHLVLVKHKAKGSNTKGLMSLLARLSLAVPISPHKVGTFLKPFFSLMLHWM